MTNSKLLKEFSDPCQGLEDDEIQNARTKAQSKTKRRRRSQNTNSYITTGEISEFNFEKKKEKAVKKYKEYVEVKKKIRLQEKKKLKRFMKKSKLPPWYRELSLNQMASADSLHNSIRDDLEQGTVHRCRLDLLGLGLKPLVNSPNTSLALKMCSGSDFAFLWFLMELFYDKTCINCHHPVHIYTVNEQIIMSAICHLDMVTTLRELDKLLPLPSKKEKDNKPKQIQDQKKLKYASPYLEPLTRPVDFTLKNYGLPQLPPISFVPYDKYSDPRYVVANEATRWFKQDLTQEITISQFEPKPICSSLNIVTNILQDQIANVTSETFDRAQVMEALCKKHKTMEDVRRELLQAFIDTTKCKNLEYFSGHKKRERIRQRVVNQMELDQARTKDEFENLAQKYQIQTWLRLFIQDLALNMPDLKNIKPCENTYSCQEEASILQKVVSKSLCLCNKFPYQAFDFGHQGTPKLNEIYFRAPRRNLPYKFDYEKIFQADFMNKVDPVQKGISTALELDKYGTEDAAINVCLAETWQNVVKLWDEKFQASQGQDDGDVNNNEGDGDKNWLELHSNIFRNAPREYVDYNPKDNALMEKLLLQAINKMKQNPKFVLASLPNVQDLPILREWIRARYGRVYTREERERTLKKSLKLFEQLLLKDVKVNLPKIEDLWPTKTASYKHRNEILIKSKKMMADHHHEVRLALLEDARICWQVMQPYHCTMGPPRNVFFSYMPASEYDVYPFRPWRVSEFMNAKFEFEKRQFKKQKEEESKI